jgi:hypothetical protein
VQQRVVDEARPHRAQHAFAVLLFEIGRRHLYAEGAQAGRLLRLLRRHMH